MAKAALQDLAKDFMSSDFLKGAIDLFTKLIELVDELVEHLGTIGSLGILGGAGLGVKKILNSNGGGILSQLLGTAGINKQLKTITDALGTGTTATSEFSAEQIKLFMQMNSGVATEEEAVEYLTRYASTAGSAAKSSVGLVTKFKNLFDSSKNASTGIGALATSLGMSAGGLCLTLAGVAAAVTGAIIAWDKFTTTVKEAQSEISKTTSEIESLNSEIEELESIGYRTDSQQKRLNFLKEELALQESILQTEKERVALEQVDSDIADVTDADNYRNKLNAATGGFDYSGKSKAYFDNNGTWENGYNNNIIAAIMNGWAQGFGKNGDSVESYISRIEKALSTYNKETTTENLNSLKSELSDAEAQALEYKKNMADLQTQLDEGLIDQDTYDELYGGFEGVYNRLNDYIVDIQKQIGTFDYTSVAKGILDNYDGVEDKLVDLCKQGKLNADNLSKYLDSSIIAALEAAGIDAEELYRIIQNIADPNKAWRDSTKESLFTDFRNANRGFYDEHHLNDEFEKAGLDLDDEATLQAYLDVKAACPNGEYEQWSSGTWIKKIKNQLASIDGEIDDSFSNSQFATDTDEFENLQSLYNSFRDNVEGSTITVPLDIGDIEGMNDVWKELDGYEDFENTVTRIGVSVDEVQEAFDDLATEYAKSKYQVDAINDSNKDMIASQMELDGITKESATAWANYYAGLNAVLQSIEVEIAAQKKRIEAQYQSNLAEAENIASVEERAKAIEKAKQQYQSEIDSLYLDCEALQNATAAEKAYYLAKQFTGVDFISGDIEQLNVIVRALGIGIDAWDAYYRAKANLDTYTSGGAVQFTEADIRGIAASGGDAQTYLKNQAQEAINGYSNELNDLLGGVDLDFTPSTTDAGSAGSSAGDAYVDAYEEELEKLESDRDAGLISEKEFLSQWKALIQKFFADVDGYADKYQSEMTEWRESMLSYMESVGSAVTTLLDRRISAAQDAKEAAVDALNDEKDAALEAYDAQMDAIEDLIDEKNEVIDGINDEIDSLNDEIDAINDAADARERDLNLQKAQYELERAMSQRTKLVYSDERGYHYETDTSTIRDAKEETDSAKREIEIAQIQEKIDAKEKEIDLIEDEIDALEKQKDAIQEERDAMEEYYDNLIEETEKMWDAIIDGLEEQKSKWEELMEISEIAEAYGKLQDYGKDLGYTVEDILSGNEEVFDQFKSDYISLLSEMHSGDEGYLNGLKEFGGAYDEVKSSATDTANAMKEVTTPVKDAATSVKDLSDSSATASKNVGTLATNTSDLKTSADGVADDLSGVSTSLEGINNLSATSSNLEAIASGLNAIKSAIGEDSAFATAIDALRTSLIGEDGTGGIVGALNQLADGSIDLTTLNDQFSLLSTTVQQVADAVGLGGGDSEGQIGQIKQGTNSLSGTAAEGTSGLASALQGLNDITFDGLVEQFNQLIEVINQVTTAINGGGEGGDTNDMSNAPSYARAAKAQGQGKGSSGEDGSLVSALTSMETTGQEATQTLIGEGESGFKGIDTAVVQSTTDIGTEDSSEDEQTLIGGIRALKNVSEEEMPSVNELFSELSGSLSSAAGALQQLIDLMGKIPSGSGGISIGKLFSGTGFSGTAYAHGNWSAKSKGLDGAALVGELGQELIVHKDGTFETVGDNGAEFAKVKPTDIVFNSNQTEELLKNGHINTRGKAYANGTFTPLTSDESKLYNIFSGIASSTELMSKGVDVISKGITSMNSSLQKVVTSNTVNNAPVINVTNPQFTCSGVTGEEVLHQIEGAFQGLFLNAYQKSMGV